MIRVSAIYPYSEGARFDMDYYANKHTPMVGGLLGDALKGVGVQKGLGGAEPGSPPPFTAIGHMDFESLETFQTAFGPNVEAIMADVPNYTDTEPILQISELVA